MHAEFYGVWFLLLGINTLLSTKFFISAAVIIIVGLFQISIGVLAYMRYVWVTIVGTVLSVLLFSAYLGHGLEEVLRSHKLDLTNVVVFVLLTIVAMPWRPQPAVSFQNSLAEA